MIDTSSMRIALDVSQIVYTGTGVGRYVYNLTKALLELDSDHEFTLYAGVLNQKTHIEHLMKREPFSQATWKLYPVPPKVADVVFNRTGISIDKFIGSQDVFHSSDWTQPRCQARKVTTVHDLVFEKYPETVDPLIRATQGRRLERIQQDSVHIIADSISTKNDLMKIYDIPSNRVDVVYPGIEASFAPQSKKEIQRVKNKYKLPDRFILSVGTQEPRKNLAKLTQVADSLDIPLVLVGRHGWGERTQTLGYVPAEDLPAIYAASTVFAYPSLYEGFGFPVLEAMAVGTPVVTSNVSSLPEVAGKAGVLIDPMSVESMSKGIQRALKERRELIQLGYKQAAKFTWAKCARATVEVYEKINRH